MPWWGWMGVVVYVVGASFAVLLVCGGAKASELAEKREREGERSDW